MENLKSVKHSVKKDVDYQLSNLLALVVSLIFTIAFYVDGLLMKSILFIIFSVSLLYNQIRLYNKYKRTNIKIDFSDIIDDKNNPETAYIPFERAKGLQNVGQVFFTDINGHWFLSNEDGSKHKDSDKLIQANLDYLEAKKKIENILKND